jgi:hypothetical protein
MEELRCVKSYGWPTGDAAVTTQSLSIESILPEALSPSRIPRARIKVKIAPRRRAAEPSEAARALAWLSFFGSTMKYHRAEALMTAVLLIEMVQRRVLSRSGEWSTHRPTLDEKRIDARARTIPLPVTHQHSIHERYQLREV